MLSRERISSSRSYLRIASSICSWIFFPPCISCGANQQRTPFFLQIRVQAVGEFPDP